jgi:hypothetical protein
MEGGQGIAMRKKGVSQIVAVSLLILLGVAAVLLLWFFIRPVIVNSSKFDANLLEGGLVIDEIEIVDDLNANIAVRREGGGGGDEGGKVNKVKVIIKDSNGNSKTEDIVVDLGELESRDIQIPLDGLSPDEIESVEVYPIVEKLFGEKVSKVGSHSKGVVKSDFVYRDLIAEYKLESNLFDNTGLGKEAVKRNDFAYSDGIIGGSVEFSDTNIVQVPIIEIENTEILDSIHETQQLTVTFWLYINEYHGIYRYVDILGKGVESDIVKWDLNDFQISIDRDKKELSFALTKIGASRVPRVVTDKDILPGNWYFISTSYKPSGDVEIHIYDEEIKDSSKYIKKATYSTQDNEGFPPQYIGTSVFIGYNLYGKVDELKIFNRALSEEEIESIWKVR